MKTIIKKSVLIVLVICMFINTNAFAYSETDGLIVPVRFKYEVKSSDLEEGNALALEVIENVYSSGMILFREYSSGVAYVDSYKKSSFLGQGGKIEVRAGYLIDVNGIRRNIIISSTSKGRGSLAPLALSLATAGLAVGIWQNIGHAKTIPILLGSAATVGTLGLASMVGEEAVISPGKIMFAHVN